MITYNIRGDFIDFYDDDKFFSQKSPIELGQVWKGPIIDIGIPEDSLFLNNVSRWVFHYYKKKRDKDFNKKLKGLIIIYGKDKDINWENTSLAINIYDEYMDQIKPFLENSATKDENGKKIGKTLNSSKEERNKKKKIIRDLKEKYNID